MKEILNWYTQLMDSYLSIAVFLAISIWVYHMWEKQEQKWKESNNFGTNKKILRAVVYILLLAFGLPGILVFITPK
jgi:nicotinamide riboside transporter PnuC